MKTVPIAEAVQLMVKQIIKLKSRCKRLEDRLTKSIKRIEKLEKDASEDFRATIDNDENPNEGNCL